MYRRWRAAGRAASSSGCPRRAALPRPADGRSVAGTCHRADRREERPSMVSRRSSRRPMSALFLPVSIRRSQTRRLTRPSMVSPISISNRVRVLASSRPATVSTALRSACTSAAPHSRSIVVGPGTITLRRRISATQEEARSAFAGAASAASGSHDFISASACPEHGR